MNHLSNYWGCEDSPRRYVINIVRINTAKREWNGENRMIPSGLIVHQQRYRPSNSNKNVDIKLSAHNTCLE